MNIPDKLVIFGHEYEVVFQDEDETCNTNLGNHWMTQCRIWINERQSQSQRESTLIHEIIEAVNDHLRLELDHKVIFALEAGLYQVLKGNNLLRD